MSIKEIKEKASPIFRSHAIARAGIFGSFARHEERPESDLDLLVQFSQPKGFFALGHLERDLSDALHRKVDLVTEKALSPYLRDRVLRDLTIIYEG